MNRSHLKARVLTSSILSAWLCAQPIAAQVVPDNTLPVGERSQVSGNPNAQIDGGARRGGNLFHSFSQFSLPTGGSASFNNAADVQNIFSRVTGGSVSNIDGVLRANGTANLFLLNPNGILFGPNASLNIGGSFVATTANAIGFPNGEKFGSDTAQSIPNQLLNINPNALFFNQLAAQSIINQSTFNRTGLQVPLKQNLMLVGGAVQLDNGRLISPGSYIELGGVSGVGTVSLLTTGEDWQLAIPTGATRADVSLKNGSNINVKGAGGGISILAQNLDISGSQLGIEIPSYSRLPNTQTGDLNLNATGSIAMSQSFLSNLLSGQGTLGSVNLSAGDRVSLDGALVYNTVQPTGVGNTGDINITTGSLSLTNSAQLQSYTEGQGNTGSVNINARDTVSFDKSDVYNFTRSTSTGAGDINIATGSLSLTNNAGLVSFTTGQGNVGSVNINARDTVSLTNNAGLASYTSGGGNAGSVNINARDRVSLDNSNIYNIGSVNGIGNVGDINITTGSLSLTNGSSLYTSTFAQRNAGSVNINARDRVSLDGTSPTLSTYNPSTIFTRVARIGVGQAGNVTITTRSLSLTNGGAVNTSTEGQGNAGRVTINARDVQISGTAPSHTTYDGEVINFPSGVTSSVRSRAVGNGGDVTITTGSLSVSDQGRINTNAQGQGKAGNIQIQASGTVSFDGGDATSTLASGGVDRGGDIEITARSLSVLNNAQLSASTAGTGDAGNITVSADVVGVNSGGRLLTTTSSNGRAGNITVNTPDLQLSGATSGLFAGTTSAGGAGSLTIQPRGNGQNVRVSLQDGAQISPLSTARSGQGGDLAIAAPGSITLTGNGSIITAGTESGGAGGNLNLRTGTLNIQNQAKVTVSSSGTGIAGNLFVDADRIFLNHQGSIRADSTGGGGNINLRSPFILLRHGSNITTNATGSNIPGGNIGIDTRFLVAVLKENSNISANSEDFRGGNVRINAVSIYGIQPSPVPTPLSDITATGATSTLNGTIDVVTSGLDPTSGLVALPVDLAGPGLIAQGCPANQGNSFVITGRGGLPPIPEQQLDDDAGWQDRRRLTIAQQMNNERDGRRREADGRIYPSTPTFHAPIIEATGWQVTPTGQVILVAATSDPAVQNPLHQPVACNDRR
ncbi:MAG: filamentous hemagglutinin N-terminal domain-containing protein [Plectolyngbya sp. WJT66-NPBG17]|jgi:filamentous hemagglutinin family protein|nr:filamentous hemagglutinin N-terminal domain-containing protein [Plectolyngbya sp. WJT66-NPBG17]